jgi:hypothetical protein
MLLQSNKQSINLVSSERRKIKVHLSGVVVGVSGAPMNELCHGGTGQVQRPCDSCRTGFRWRF